MDIIINDLAGQYAIQTEDDATDRCPRGRSHRRGEPGSAQPRPPPRCRRRSGTRPRPCTPRPPATASVIAVDAPNMLGLIGPLFAPVNPQNAQSAGFTAGNFGSGAVGSHQRHPDLRLRRRSRPASGLILSTAAAEVYEDRGRPLAGRRAVRARRPGRLLRATSRRWSCPPPGSSRSRAA